MSTIFFRNKQSMALYIFMAVRNNNRNSDTVQTRNIVNIISDKCNIFREQAPVFDLLLEYDQFVIHPLNTAETELPTPGRSNRILFFGKDQHLHTSPLS